MTLIELLLGVAVASVLVGIALPLVKNALAAYDMSAAVAAVSGSIQSTRYQAIATGWLMISEQLKLMQRTVTKIGMGKLQ